MHGKVEKMTGRLVVVALAALSVFAMGISAASAKAPIAKRADTSRCVSMVTEDQRVTTAAISACEHSPLKVLQVCPKGVSTVLVVVHGRTYGFRLGSRPILLARQYGMGTISQTCG